MKFTDKAHRNKAMRAVRSTGSGIEVKLCKELWRRGYRYRKNCKNVFGKPDIVFRKHKLAIFCDSEFWHGKTYNQEMKKISNNKSFWVNKIKRNMDRDKEVNRMLKKEGWIVLRFWGKEIEKDLDGCVDKIINIMRKG